MTRRSNAGQPIHHTDCNENSLSQPGKNSTVVPSTSAENFSCDQNLQLQHHNMSLKTRSEVDTFRVIHTAAKFISKRVADPLRIAAKYRAPAWKVQPQHQKIHQGNC
ncbi:hypothetical protein Nepgr_013535 [Nepenthes gracilis]|uniref:Uncharacterized protein n=1 Tax=Nepenthes gracilis TaxID=150966 RepID=A0AAD3SJ32_NEPGR|nr:hypothetical protein Nepgr_013535 [Nepenthes gracilis]